MSRSMFLIPSRCFWMLAWGRLNEIATNVINGQKVTVSITNL
jgi:hypothetical protein